MKINYLIITACLLTSQLVVSQNDTITGVLLDAKNKVIKNYPVTLGKVSPVTVKTDKYGFFTFHDANLLDTLFVGDKKGRNPIAIPVDGHLFVAIKSLKGNFNAEYLSETDDLIRNYLQKIQQATKADFNILRSEDIEQSGCLDITCLLSRVNGVTIENNQVLLRGGGFSRYGTNGALLILDGIIVGNSIDDVNSIPIEEIDNITVLKDASTYGTRGANGAILIRTKRS